MLGTIKKFPCHIWIQQTMKRRRSGRDRVGEGIKKRSGKKRSGLSINDEALGRGQIRSQRSRRMKRGGRRGWGGR